MHTTKTERRPGDVRQDGYVFKTMGTQHNGTKYEVWLQPHLYEKHRLKHLYYMGRHRAKKHGLPFDLDIDYLQSIFPKDGRCPVLGTPMYWGTRADKRNSPSVDRVVPELGYVKGNVNIISFRANQIKSDASLPEMEKVVSYLTNCPRAPSAHGRD